MLLGMEAQELGKLARLVKIALGANLAVLVVNLALFYALLVLVVDEPASVDGVNPLESREQAQDVTDPRKEMEDFFERTADMLDRVARKHGANPAEFVPAQLEIEAAIETRTIHSDESQAVLQKLREGYDYFDMSWPIVMPQR